MKRARFVRHSLCVLNTNLDAVMITKWKERKCLMIEGFSCIAAVFLL